MKLTVPYFALLSLLALAVSSCNPTKRLQDDEVFLRKQRIKLSVTDTKHPVSREELTTVLRQKTNRRIFGVLRFNLWAYNAVSEERIAKAGLRKANRRASRNERRTSRGKAQLAEKTQTKWSWLKYTVGEPPAMLDSTGIEKSEGQISVYLQKNGFFNERVSHTVDLSRKGRRARLTFLVEPGIAYTIGSISYTSKDSLLASRMPFLLETSILKTGDQFRVEKLDEERERIARYLNNRGYFGFTKSYLNFEADSTAGKRQTNLKLVVGTSMKESVLDPTELVPVLHERYFIGDIYVHTDYDPTSLNAFESDTLDYKGITILSSGRPAIKPNLLNFTFYLKEGELYQRDKVDLTYRRFNNLGIMQSMNLRFQERMEGKTPLLDCHLYLKPAKRQSLSIETTGTHRSGILGVSANVVYAHKNVFRGAEILDFRIHTGLEAQPPLTRVEESEVQAGEDFGRALILNTFEIGPELSLVLPSLFPFNVERLSRNNDPSTRISASFNYQNRPDYRRTLSSLRLGYRFRETRFKTHLVDLMEINLIKIRNSPEFIERIESLNDLFLLNSYRDHFIAATGYAFQYNNQEPRFQRHHTFNSLSAEFAGNLLRGIFSAGGFAKDENDSYRLLGIRFAQYMKFENDFRYYVNSENRNTAVFRIDAAVGIPLNNLDVLPFEESYFAGGSNGIRAWQARTLGPGSYRDSTAALTFNNIGEVKIELNVEYRFDLAGSLKGAFFVDAGNIWLLNEDRIRQGSGFSGSEFLSELAVGGGFGLRFDFDYFLIRLDTGVQLKDPAKIPGERWFFEPKEEYNEYLFRLNPEDPARYRARANFNLGIGYPF